MNSSEDELDVFYRPEEESTHSKESLLKYLIPNLAITIGHLFFQIIFVVRHTRRSCPRKLSLVKLLLSEFNYLIICQLTLWAPDISNLASKYWLCGGIVGQNVILFMWSCAQLTSMTSIGFYMTDESDKWFCLSILSNYGIVVISTLHLGVSLWRGICSEESQDRHVEHGSSTYWFVAAALLLIQLAIKLAHLRGEHNLSHLSPAAFWSKLRSWVQSYESSDKGKLYTLKAVNLFYNWPIGINFKPKTDNVELMNMYLGISIQLITHYFGAKETEPT